MERKKHKKEKLNWQLIKSLPRNTTRAIWLGFSPSDYSSTFVSVHGQVNGARINPAPETKIRKEKSGHSDILTGRPTFWPTKILIKILNAIKPQRQPLLRHIQFFLFASPDLGKWNLLVPVETFLQCSSDALIIIYSFQSVGSSSTMRSAIKMQSLRGTKPTKWFRFFFPRCGLYLRCGLVGCTAHFINDTIIILVAIAENEQSAKTIRWMAIFSVGALFQYEAKAKCLHLCCCVRVNWLVTVCMQRLSLAFLLP